MAPRGLSVSSSCTTQPPTSTSSAAAAAAAVGDVAGAAAASRACSKEGRYTAVMATAAKDVGRLRHQRRGMGDRGRSRASSPTARLPASAWWSTVSWSPPPNVRSKPSSSFVCIFVLGLVRMRMRTRIRAGEPQAFRWSRGAVGAVSSSRGRRLTQRLGQRRAPRLADAILPQVQHT